MKITEFLSQDSFIVGENPFILVFSGDERLSYDFEVHPTGKKNSLLLYILVYESLSQFEVDEKEEFFFLVSRVKKNIFKFTRLQNYKRNPEEKIIDGELTSIRNVFEFNLDKLIEIAYREELKKLWRLIK